MKTIFIVDDNNANLFTAQKSLSKEYKVFTLPSAAAMFELLEDIIPDLILMDIKMPGMDGFEATQELRKSEKHSNIPVIFLTGQIDANTETKAFELGAVDFIPKPFSGGVLLNRIKTHIDMESIINQRLNNMASAFANIIESRDKFTKGHTKRISMYVKFLLDEIKDENLPSGDSVILASQLHDVGKISVPQLILNKDGSLTPDEFEKMKNHTIESEKIIDELLSDSLGALFLQNAKLFALSHHERWDGKGYPYSLKGMNIPLQGRVLALADVYDALVTQRPYKKALTHEQALETIRESKGEHFDPKIVEVFLDINGKFAEVSSCQQ